MGIRAAHRRRKMLEVEGGLDINAHKARAKFLATPTFIKNPPILASSRCCWSTLARFSRLQRSRNEQ